MTTRTLVFAGAGASTAINRSRFPTTKDFFDQLPERILSNELFKMIVRFLRNDDIERVIDIEEVLWELRNLRRFAYAVRDGSDIVGHALQNDQLATLALGQGHNFNHFSSAIAQTANIADKLNDQINAVVYDLYSHEPAAAELKNNWSHLITKLRAINCLADIFTTNYDVAIETAISLDSKVDFDDFLGYKNLVNKQLDLDRWRNPKTDTALLTKLHGSINWQSSGKSIHVGAPVFTGIHKNHAIIYPGFKGDNESEFFAPLHSYLGDKLEAADVLLFIGFAFRDDHINQVIADRVESGTKVFVINPDKSVKYPVKRHKPEYISSGFDRQSINQAISLFPIKANFKMV